MKPRIHYVLRSCHGINPRTGRPVGERHRWSGGKWGVGRCIWCLRDLQELRHQVVAPTQSKLEISQEP